MFLITVKVIRKCQKITSSSCVDQMERYWERRFITVEEGVIYLVLGMTRLFIAQI